MKLSNYLRKNDKYLLACSFGPDSMSLFYMLKKEGYLFDVAHVNYGLRPEAKDETQKLVEYCNQEGIKLFTLFADVDKTKNIENECRKIRYELFAKLCNENKYKAVLVAHNEDDLLETYLIQKSRKIYAKHYGIAENCTIFGVNIIRPLLKYKKSDLEKYCLENNVPYCIDSSNLKDEFLRNKIRHSIVSKLSNNERQLLINDINDRNKRQNEMLVKLSQMDLENNKLLISLNEDELCLALNMMIKSVSSSSSISLKCASEIKQILLSKKPNSTFAINKNVSFVKEYETCKFVSNKKEGAYSFIVGSPVLIDNEFFYFDFRKDLSKRKLCENDFPLTIRTYQKGDSYLINGYLVPVRRLFIDWKMPTSLRKKWPIILNKEGNIQYIPRFKCNFNRSESPDFFVK